MSLPADAMHFNAPTRATGYCFSSINDAQNKIGQGFIVIRSNSKIGNVANKACSQLLQFIQNLIASGISQGFATLTFQARHVGSPLKRATSYTENKKKTNHISEHRRAI